MVIHGCRFDPQVEAVQRVCIIINQLHFVIIHPERVSSVCEPFGLQRTLVKVYAEEVRPFIIIPLNLISISCVFHVAILFLGCADRRHYLLAADNHLEFLPNLHI